MASGGQARKVRSHAGSDVVERVAKLNAKLASEEGGDESVLKSLRQLQSVRMTFEALEATKVGRAVNALRKSAPSEQARHLAAELYRRWKALANEHFATLQRARAAAAEAAAPKVVVDGSDVACPPPPVVAKEKEKQQLVTAGAAANGSTSAAVAEVVAMPPAVVKKQRNILRLVIKKPSGGNGSNVRQPSAAVSQATTASHQGRPAVASKRVSEATKSTASLAKQQGKPPPPTAVTKLPPPTALTKPSGSGACKRKGAPAAGMDEARLAKARKKLHEGYKEASTAKEKRKIQVIEATSAKGWRAPVSSCTTMSSRGK
jgi:hypothetical protein